MQRPFLLFKIFTDIDNMSVYSQALPFACGLCPSHYGTEAELVTHQERRGHALPGTKRRRVSTAAVRDDADDDDIPKQVEASRPLKQARKEVSASSVVVQQPPPLVAPSSSAVSSSTKRDQPTPVDVPAVAHAGAPPVGVAYDPEFAKGFLKGMRTRVHQVRAFRRDSRRAECVCS